MSSIDPPRLSPKAGKSARTRAVLAQEVQEKLGEALTHLQKLSVCAADVTGFAVCGCWLDTGPHNDAVR